MTTEINLTCVPGGEARYTTICQTGDQQAGLFLTDFKPPSVESLKAEVQKVALGGMNPDYVDPHGLVYAGILLASAVAAGIVLIGPSVNRIPALSNFSNRRRSQAWDPSRVYHKRLR